MSPLKSSHCFASLPSLPVIAVTYAVSAALLGVVHAQTTPTPPTATADAQNDKNDKAKPQVVDKVEIKGSLSDVDEREDTATKIVVTSDEIRKFGDTQIPT